MLRGSKVSETVSQVLQWVSLGRRSLNPDQEQEPSTAPLRRLGVGADRGSPRPKSKRGSAPAPPPELSTGQPLSPSPLLEPCSLDLRLATCDLLLAAVQTEHALFPRPTSPDAQSATMLFVPGHSLSSPALALALTLALLVRSAAPGEWGVESLT